MSDLSTGIVTLLAVDFAFAAITGVTGLHGVIVDAGAHIGEALGITPLFGAEAAFEPVIDTTDHALHGLDCSH